VESSETTTLPVEGTKGPVEGTKGPVEGNKGCAVLREEALIPITWPWLLGYYVGIPLMLVILRPELLPDAWPDRLRHYGTTVLATLGIGGPMHAVYAFLMPRWLVRVGDSRWRLALHAAVILTCVNLGKAAVRPLLLAICLPGVNRDPAQESLIATAVALVVVAATTSYTRLQRRARDIERREQQARHAALRAQLEALQARTNPHFLFNSLNVVASLIATDPACAEETVERLSGLFRYTLDGSRRTSVRLSEELAATEDYLDVEALRFGDRLTWRVDVDPSLGRVRIPPLILQPLVENAVRHGIASRREGGAVTITGVRHDDCICLTVEDDGTGDSPHRGSGTSLSDLERRLGFAYGDAATIVRRQRNDGGWTVTLTLPDSGPTVSL
jgi:two-component system, LytTR family, sensor histidine kinase AlgZ